MKPPQPAQAAGIVPACQREGLQQRGDGAIVPFRQQPQRRTVPPGIIVLEQFHQLPIRFPGQVCRGPGLGALALNLVNAAVGHVPAIGRCLVARVLIVPVDHIDRAVRSPAQVDRPKVLVAAHQKVRAVMGNERGAAAFEDVALDAARAVHGDEDIVLVFGRDLISLEHQESGMGPAAFTMVRVVTDLVQKSVGIGILAAAGLADVGAAGNDVEEMRNDAGGQKRLAMGVEVESPGIARAFSKNTELVGVRVIAPDGGVHLHAADLGLGEDAVQAVEQAVRSPLQRV